MNINPTKLYSIKTAMDVNMVLDNSQNNDVNKKFTACLWKNTGDHNQKFRIIQQGNSEYYVIENPSTKKFMQIKNSKINNGAKVVFD